MSAHLSEQEQVEALKRWWKDNGRQTIFAVVLGVAAYLGWNQYQDYQQSQAEQASVTYMRMMELEQSESALDRSEENRASVIHQATELKDQAAGSQYAYYASLMIAKMAVEQQDYERASNELKSVVESSADVALKNIARLRLAKVELAAGNADQALQLLQVNGGELEAAYAELRGDIHAKKGEFDQARTAYELAMSNAGQGQQLLQLKLNKVAAQVEPTEPDQSADTTEQNNQ